MNECQNSVVLTENKESEQNALSKNVENSSRVARDYAAAAMIRHVWDWANPKTNNRS